LRAEAAYIQEIGLRAAVAVEAFARHLLKLDTAVHLLAGGVGRDNADGPRSEAAFSQLSSDVGLDTCDWSDLGLAFFIDVHARGNGKAPSLDRVVEHVNQWRTTNSIEPLVVDSNEPETERLERVKSVMGVLLRLVRVHVDTCPGTSEEFRYALLQVARDIGGVPSAPNSEVDHA
jgi:hypothetical protein